MLNSKSKYTNLNWDEFIEEKKKTNDFNEIINSIGMLEKEQNLYSLEKVLNLLKEEEFNDNPDVYNPIWKKLQEESKNIDRTKLNWWDKFFIDRGKDITIRNILKEVETADKTGEKRDIVLAMESIESLNEDIYEYDINILNQRIKILEKRIDRKINDNFGSLLASIRKQKGLSLAKLGKMAGVSASYINRIELNQRQAPSYPIIEKIANVLEVNVGTLLPAARANLAESEVKNLRELIFSNNISLGENKEDLTIEKKENLIEIIDYIENIGWTENKHIETINLLNLIDRYKN